VNFRAVREVASCAPSDDMLMDATRLDTFAFPLVRKESKPQLPQ
jgi:hypothetical protein